MAKEGEMELRGLKAIADFLEVSDRTVKRWIADGRGVPVKRIGGRLRAYPGQLRAWTEGNGGV